MRAPRLYTSQTLTADRSVLLEAAPSHHLLKVLRTQTGDPVILFNGDGHEYPATIEGREGKLARLAVSAKLSPQRESHLPISLGQGISRGERMDLVMQKAVELGVNEITPLWTARSQVQLKGERLEKRLRHWQGVVVAACEQSGRVHLPPLRRPTGLDDWLQPMTDTTCLILHPDAECALPALGRPTQVRILLGPEGGFDSAETQRAEAAGFIPVRLGPRTLRTETATLATLAALQTLWGDFA